MADIAETSTANSSNEQKTQAQLLQEKHEAAAKHNATVEDVADEEDLAHPPPSNAVADKEENDDSVQANGGYSAKAAGKQKAKADSYVHNEDNFPSLGGGPKATPTAPPPTWGSKPKGVMNGTQNGSTPRTSGSSTPNSGMPASAFTSNTSRPQKFGQAPAPTNIPGKFTHYEEFPAAHMDKTKNRPEVYQKIKKATGVIITETPVMENNKLHSFKLTATGPKAKLKAAMIQASAELTQKRTEKYEVPEQVRAHIIGKAGSNIKAIEQSTGAQIKLDNDIKDGMVIVNITGNASAINQASAELGKIVNQRPITMDVRMSDVPPEFFPFIESDPRLIRTRHANPEIKIQVPQYSYWSQQRPPAALPRDRFPEFVPHSNMHIGINGPQIAAIKAKAELEALVQELRQTLILEDQNYERAQHQFLPGGPKGISPEDFFRETGCVVILPPDHHQTDDVTIIGPADRLDAGIEKAQELAAEWLSGRFDPQKQFVEAAQGANSHARALALYFQERNLQDELHRAHGAQIAFPSPSGRSTDWDIFAKQQMSINKARADLAKIVQAHPPARVNRVSVHPFYYPHLKERCAQSFREELGIHMILPQNDDPIVLVYQEDRSPEVTLEMLRQLPSEKEIEKGQKALQDAQDQILKLTNFQQILERDVEVAKKFHDKARKFGTRERDSAPVPDFPVEITSVSHNSVRLRGPTDNVEDLEPKLLIFLQQALQDEKERNHVTTFDFPAKHFSHLIGRNGAHVNSLRDKHDVQIDTKDTGKVHLTGPPRNAAACQAEIMKLLKGWEDEVTLRVAAEPRYHSELIGKGGSNLNRLQERSNNEVRIQFPRNASTPDDRSVVDTASEAGGNKTSRPPQEANIILIRGPRQKAEATRDELYALYKHIQDNSHTATVSVAKEQIPKLMGRRGQEMEKLRVDTNAAIEVPNAQESANDSRVTIQIRGSKEAVDKAKSELLKRSKAFDDIVTRVLNVDKKHHQSLIGGSGSNIRRIVTEAGGPANSAEAVKFPARDDDSTEIRIQGTSLVVAKICSAIEEHAAERESQVTESIDVPKDKHRLLIGTGGQTRRQLESDFKVILNIPSNGSHQTEIKVTGGATEVAKAIEHISNLTKSQPTQTVLVPRHLHHSVAQQGRFFAALKKKDIIVDHGRQKPPPKPETNTVTPRANGATPLITDEADPDGFSWHIVEMEVPSDSDQTIAWNLTGKSEDSVADAKALVEKAVEEASRPNATGYLILPDPQMHRHIIGPGGSTIKGIRQATKCDIQVPNSRAGKGEEGEAITIVGPTASVEQAKDLVWAAVQKGKSGGGGSRPSSSRT